MYIQFHRGCKWWWHDHNNDHDANVGKYVHPSTPISWQRGYTHVFFGRKVSWRERRQRRTAKVIQFKVTKRYRLVGTHQQPLKGSLKYSKKKRNSTCVVRISARRTLRHKKNMCLWGKPSVALQHNTTKKAVPNACYQRKPIKSQNPSVSISAFSLVVSISSATWVKVIFVKGRIGVRIFGSWQVCRFRLGSPRFEKTCFRILVVTSQHPGKGDSCNYRLCNRLCIFTNGSPPFTTTLQTNVLRCKCGGNLSWFSSGSSTSTLRKTNSSHPAGGFWQQETHLNQPPVFQVLTGC